MGRETDVYLPGLSAENLRELPAAVDDGPGGFQGRRAKKRRLIVICDPSHRSILAPPPKGRHRHRHRHQLFLTFKKKVAEEPNDGANYLSILIDCFRSYNAEPTPYAYSFIIRYLFQRHMLSHLPPVLDRLEKAERFDVPQRIFVSVIRSFGRANRLHDAVDIFHRIPNFRCTPSVISLNALLSVLCKSKEGIVLVGDVLLKTPEMNIRLEASTFRILIKALCRNGKLNSAIEILRMMPLHECTPNAKLYSLQDNLEQSRRMITCMERAGCNPDIETFNTLLAGYAKVGDMAKAKELMNEALDKGLQWNSHSYEILIDGFVGKGEKEEARQLLMEMISKGESSGRLSM
ncbi:hypothetical protein C4D60_Mb06t01020 [Musa balbisiana]|uniref:Pentacotripeptide-repeat region of PRORP domain-containing protein n=1 Tax=Musa balbisiana TaxID=52838 RepID=A0A4S8IJS4_MUSBA|nr:hypothetical protein C4D60_Mb06t01020 [Musa balbisiana]